MKKLIYAIAVLIIFIVVSIFIEYNIQKNVNIMMEDIKKLTENLQNEKWEQVDSEFDNMVNIWEEKGKLWGTIVEHEEIDKLTISLYKSKVYANFREKEEALAELKEFEFMVDHIPKTYKLELRNIF